MSHTPGGGPSRAGLTQTALIHLDEAWKEREEEAKALRLSGFHSTSASLRIYALEILLKVLVCRKLELPLLPSACRTHNLEEVLLFTGLTRELQEPSRASIRQSWDILVDYSKKQLNDQRYQPRSTFSSTEADQIDQALDDPNLGVLAWLLNRP